MTELRRAKVTHQTFDNLIPIAEPPEVKVASKKWAWPYQPRYPFLFILRLTMTLFGVLLLIVGIISLIIGIQSGWAGPFDFLLLLGIPIITCMAGVILMASSELLGLIQDARLDLWHIRHERSS